LWAVSSWIRWVTVTSWAKAVSTWVWSMASRCDAPAAPSTAPSRWSYSVYHASRCACSSAESMQPRVALSCNCCTSSPADMVCTLLGSEAIVGNLSCVL
jgi:hypothetical protein